MHQDAMSGEQGVQRRTTVPQCLAAARGAEEGVYVSVEGSPIVAESLLLTEGSHGEQASSSLEAAGVVFQ
jgi:hypothetical protein